MQSRIERLAPFTGVVYFVLYVVALIVAANDSPDFMDTSAKNLAYYVQHKDDAMLGGLLLMLAIVFLLWFLGSIRRMALASEGGDGRVTSIGFAGGAVGVALFLAGAAVYVLPALRLDEQDRLTAETATTMTDLSNGLMGFAAPMGFAVLLIAVAVVGIRCGALPAWWAWITGILGIVMLVPWVSWAGMFFAFPVWVLVMVALLVRAGATQRAAA